MRSTDMNMGGMIDDDGFGFDGGGWIRQKLA